MIHIFNRKELFTTFNLEEQIRIRERLAATGIDCSLKTVNRTSPYHASSGVRGRTGTFGLNQAVMYEYIFYVKRKDYDRAMAVLR